MIVHEKAFHERTHYDGSQHQPRSFKLSSFTNRAVHLSTLLLLQFTDFLAKPYVGEAKAEYSY